MHSDGEVVSGERRRQSSSPEDSDDNERARPLQIGPGMFRKSLQPRTSKYM